MKETELPLRRRITIIANGVLLQDDDAIVESILQKVRALMENSQALREALDTLTVSIQTLLGEVEDLLTQPEPDVTQAVEVLHALQISVDLEASKVHDTLHPAPAPEEPSA